VDKTAVVEGNRVRLGSIFLTKTCLGMYSTKLLWSKSELYCSCCGRDEVEIANVDSLRLEAGGGMAFVDNVAVVEEFLVNSNVGFSGLLSIGLLLPFQLAVDGVKKSPFCIAGGFHSAAVMR
jgi:hypothetical protein